MTSANRLLTKQFGIMVDIARCKADGQSVLSLYTCDDAANFYGIVAPWHDPGVILNITQGTYIKAISAYSSSDITYEVYSHDVYQTSKSYGTLTTYQKAKISENDMVAFLQRLPGAVLSLLSLVVFLIGLVLWIIDPTHLLLILVSAESIMVLLALTSSKNIFVALGKFARYNEMAFRVVESLAGSLIAILANAASFVYNILHALWPLG